MKEFNINSQILTKKSFETIGPVLLTQYFFWKFVSGVSKCLFIELNSAIQIHVSLTINALINSIPQVIPEPESNSSLSQQSESLVTIFAESFLCHKDGDSTDILFVIIVNKGLKYFCFHMFSIYIDNGNNIFLCVDR